MDSWDFVYFQIFRLKSKMKILHWMKNIVSALLKLR